MNIIIPLGELGENFKKDGYFKPKPLINILGKPMIFFVIDSLSINESDNLIIIYDKQLNNYNFDIILKNKYKNIKLIELNKKTYGPMETVLFGLENIDDYYLKNKCVLLDCDTFYNIDILEICRKLNNNTIFSFKDNQDNNIYSYVKFNKNNIITDIQEKVKISEYANTGCYFFNNGNLLKLYCNNIIEETTAKIKFENINSLDEYYASYVIKKMIENNIIFNFYNVNLENFNCVGTPLQLKIFCSNFLNNTVKKRFCFDIDSVLIIISENNENIVPNIKNIEYLKYLKKMGHVIILNTSKDMNKFNGNIGKVNKSGYKIILDAIEKFNIPYDEIYFNKPYADFYIDNNSISTFNDLEKQIGFYKTFVEERDFNQIIHDKMDIITKRSNNNKLHGEIHYYLNIPQSLKKYFPLFINYGTNWYSLEKIKGITMSYLYVNESLSNETFINFLEMFKNIHETKIDNETVTIFDNIITQNINIYENYSNKIKDRYKNYDYSKFSGSHEIYNNIIESLTLYEKNNKGIKGIIHGDSVFSNCLIDENNSFKLIDMRGKNNDTLTIFGDILYDYAKIYQSIIGYDEILLKKNVSNYYRKNLINIFFSFIKDFIGEEYIEIIKIITKSLLFTLIPLHNNDNCNDFYKLIYN
jgi:capsule biosynthesis phosphatase